MGLYEQSRNTKQYKLLIDAGFKEVTPAITRKRGSFTFKVDVMGSWFYITPKSGVIRKHSMLTVRRNMPQLLTSIRGPFKTLAQYEDAFRFLRMYFDKRAKKIILNIFKQKTEKWQPNKYITGGAK